jgi:hypothetical protein
MKGTGLHLETAKTGPLFPMNDKLDILKSREIPPSAIRGKDGKFYSVEQGCGVVRNASGKVLSIEAGGLDAHRPARREHRREH